MIILRIIIIIIILIIIRIMITIRIIIIRIIIIIIICNICHSINISHWIARQFIRSVCPLDDVSVIPFSPCFSSQLPCVRLISLLIAYSTIPFHSTLKYFLHSSSLISPSIIFFSTFPFSPPAPVPLYFPSQFFVFLSQFFVFLSQFFVFFSQFFIFCSEWEGHRSSSSLHGNHRSCLISS